MIRCAAFLCLFFPHRVRALTLSRAALAGHGRCTRCGRGVVWRARDDAGYRAMVIEQLLSEDTEIVEMR